jgi:hypothetical protein
VEQRSARQHDTLKADGSIVGWGWNYGLDATAGTYFGQAVAPPGTNFVAIAAGDRYSLAIQVQRPVLSIAQVGSNVVLSWPFDDSNYTLEANTNLSSSLNWSEVPGAPTVVDNQYTVTNTIANGNAFYRLKK